MRTDQHLEKRVQVFFTCPSKNSMAGTEKFMENIEIWVSTPLVQCMETHAHIVLHIMRKVTFVRNHAKLL